MPREWLSGELPDIEGQRDQRTGARNWALIVGGMSAVMKLVHLASRNDSFDTDGMRAELLRLRRTAYNDELTQQAALAGCPGRRGALVNGAILSQLNDMCIRDAKSISNTYNYDVAAAIVAIRSDAPTANRHVYAFRLRKWEAKRAKWKMPQIMQYTDSSARSLAQQHFYAYNDIQGVAILQPRSAVCPVCMGWVARGEVPLPVAMADPPPYHINCPHKFVTFPNRVAKLECPNLWMGG